MALHTHWRDCDAWKKAGIPLSTTSNEACKLYDATLTQYVGWYDDKSVGGIENSIDNLIKADPSFVMGHVIAYGIDLMGTGHTTRLDPQFKANIDDLVCMANNSEISEQEKLHVKAVKLCADGYMSEATDVWERILIENPLDMLALKFCHDSYFYLGYLPQMRDSIARVFPAWKNSMPNYGYLYGMHAFGLEETNLFDQAEKAGKKSLEINRQDPWATHAVAHVMEMTGRQNDGISFMSTTVEDWSPCGMLACHNFWHWAVYHIEKGEYQAALDIFDSEVGVRCKNTGALLDIVDACSLLYRLEMEGVSVGGRWNDVYETCKPHTDDHILSFNDAHILMSCLGAKQTDTTQQMLKSLRDYISNGEGTNHKVAKEVGMSICEALIAYDEGDYTKAVDILYPVRYKVLAIGGSNAQRDLYNLFLIHAALKSPKKEHHKLARQLLAERKSFKDSAPMTDRLIARALACHVD